MKYYLEIACALALSLLLIDFLGFIAWVASGQHPTDGFYVGAITAHVLALVF